MPSAKDLERERAVAEAARLSAEFEEEEATPKDKQFWKDFAKGRGNG